MVPEARASRPIGSMAHRPLRTRAPAARRPTGYGSGCAELLHAKVRRQSPHRKSSQTVASLPRAWAKSLGPELGPRSWEECLEAKIRW
jgi:hypothetical protein